MNIKCKYLTFRFRFLEFGSNFSTLLQILFGSESFNEQKLLNSHLSSLTIYFPLSEPIIKFAETKFSVSEPKESGQMTLVKIPIHRTGDASKVSLVRVHTKDGSAISGEDYHPISLGKTSRDQNGSFAF